MKPLMNKVSVHNVGISQLLQAFWMAESLPADDVSMTEEEQAAVQYFQDHHIRALDGLFMVNVPSAPVVHDIGESRRTSAKRFKQNRSFSDEVVGSSFRQCCMNMFLSTMLR